MTFRECLEERGMSQSDLSRLLGVDRRYVSYWATGKRLPSEANKKRLVEIFGEEILDCLGKRRASRAEPDGEKLRAFFRKRFVSPAQASRMIGVSQTTVSNWVNGLTRPYTQNLRRLVEVFGEEVLDCFKED